MLQLIGSCFDHRNQSLGYRSRVSVRMPIFRICSYYHYHPSLLSPLTSGLQRAHPCQTPGLWGRESLPALRTTLRSKSHRS